MISCVTLRCRAEEVFAGEGMARTHLGYEGLVKLKVDEVLERESLSTVVNHNDGPAEIAAT
jgi:hypothetical protein